MLLQTLGQVSPPLVQVGGVEAGLAAVVADVPVDVGAAHAIPVTSSTIFSDKVELKPGE